jgi:outer membrane biosynthesis protein TonB
MPSCYERSNCKAPSLPLDNRHACALCESELHGICGYFYQEESIRFQNVCGLCKSALEKKKFELEMAGLPALPHPLTAEQVRDTDVVPEIKKRVFELDHVSDPMLPPKISSKPQEESTKPPLPPSKSSKPSRKIKPVPLKSKKVTGKEKPNSGTSGTSKKQEKTPKKNDQATSSSTVNAKEKSDGKPKKIPTPGTRASPRIRANLTASVSATPTEEVEETPNTLCGAGKHIIILLL